MVYIYLGRLWKRFIGEKVVRKPERGWWVNRKYGGRKSGWKWKGVYSTCAGLQKGVIKVL